MKFRNLGRLEKTDARSFNNKCFEFVNVFIYLGVKLKNIGGYTKHVQYLQQKPLVSINSIDSKVSLSDTSLDSA